MEILQNLLALKTSNTNAPVDESNARGGVADSKSAASTWKCKTDVLSCFVCVALIGHMYTKVTQLMQNQSCDMFNLW